jgi:heat shock protein HtpX
MIVCISFATVVAELLLRFVSTAKINKSKNSNSSAATQIFFCFSSSFLLRIAGCSAYKITVSRTREFRADANTSLITRNLQGLVDALKKISGNSTAEKLSDK